MKKTEILNRELYKKIKKMDRRQMEIFLKEFLEDHSKPQVTEIEFSKDETYKIITQALDETKGIGEKLKNSFLDKFKALTLEKAKEKEKNE